MATATPSRNDRSSVSPDSAPPPKERRSLETWCKDHKPARETVAVLVSTLALLVSVVAGYRSNALAAERTLTPSVQLNATPSEIELEVGQSAYFSLDVINTGAARISSVVFDNVDESQVQCASGADDLASTAEVALEDGAIATLTCKVSNDWALSGKPVSVPISVYLGDGSADHRLSRTHLEILTVPGSLQTALVPEVTSAFVGEEIAATLHVSNPGSMARTNVAIEGGGTCDGEVVGSIAPNAPTLEIPCLIQLGSAGENRLGVRVNGDFLAPADADVMVQGIEPSCPTISSDQPGAPEAAATDEETITPAVLVGRLTSLVGEINPLVCPAFRDLILETQTQAAGPLSAQDDGASEPQSTCDDLLLKLRDDLPQVLVSFNVEKGCDARSITISSESDADIDNVTLSIAARAITGRPDIGDLVLGSDPAIAIGLLGCATPVTGTPPAWSMHRFGRQWVFDACP